MKIESWWLRWNGCDSGYYNDGDDECGNNGGERNFERLL
jgi:hypothetical protein